jgi:hypothetical protein
MPVVQEFMKKLTANERLAVWGAVIVVIGSIFGSGWLALIGGIAVIALYWLKYSPTTNINWPAPVQLIALGISGIIALFAIMGALGSLGFGSLGGFFFGGMYIVWLLAAIAVAIGAVMMVLGTWREYQAMPKAAPPSTPPAPPASPSGPPAA